MVLAVSLTCSHSVFSPSVAISAQWANIKAQLYYVYCESRIYVRTKSKQDDRSHNDTPLYTDAILGTLGALAKKKHCHRPSHLTFLWHGNIYCFILVWSLSLKYLQREFKKHKSFIFMFVKTEYTEKSNLPLQSTNWLPSGPPFWLGGPKQLPVLLMMTWVHFFRY